MTQRRTLSTRCDYFKMYDHMKKKTRMKGGRKMEEWREIRLFKWENRSAFWLSFFEEFFSRKQVYNIRHVCRALFSIKFKIFVFVSIFAVCPSVVLAFIVFSHLSYMGFLFYPKKIGFNCCFFPLNSLNAKL